MADKKPDSDYKADESKDTMPDSSGTTISWTASEFIDHQRGASWYLWLVAGTVALGSLIYILTEDKIATVSVLIVGAVVGSVAHWKPRQVHYQLSLDGLQIDSKAYSYDQFKTFSIVHEGNLSSLVFHPLKRFMPPVSVFFDEDDEDEITGVIGDHLPLEEGGPDRIDRLSRRLRF